MSIIGAAVLVACSGPSNETTAPMDGVSETNVRPTPQTVEDRFAILALDCVHREYPNKISHVLHSDADVQRPRDLTPAFYGCFDWHSSVHGHWLLSRLLNTQPDSVLADEIREKLAQSLTEENLAGELAYYTMPGRGSFERPYGIAWFLQLVAELDESDDPQMQIWRERVRPLETAIVGKTRDWLPKLSYPIRLGTHNQSAFAFGLMLDYARQVGDQEFEADLAAKTLAFHMNDANCPMAYEPSGEDFLSPCLMVADLMRRVLSEQEFAAWLGAFLPDIPFAEDADWLQPGIVLDASDGKLVHLDGVNLSRAWALKGVASALPENDPRRAALLASARRHSQVGIASVSDEHYSGSHWLASFATYLTTDRGISAAHTQP